MMLNQVLLILNYLTCKKSLSIHDLLQTNSMSSSVSGSESQSTKQLQICQCGCKTVQTCHVVSRKLQTCQCLTMSFQPGLQGL